jgi:hypothetical protein
MNWSASQQAMLEAMGYTLYRDAHAPVPALPPDPAHPLMQALRRAAGGRELAGLALPPLDRLREDAAAKRALWPRLRALRRG